MLKEEKTIDIQIHDYKQCFDSLWLEECLNDIYSGGLKDDKFNLLYSANQECLEDKKYTYLYKGEVEIPLT